MIQPDRDTVFTKDELRVLESFRRSRVWARLRDALCYRREQLFNENESTTEQLWKNRGRLLEIQWLLSNTPMLMVQYERYRKSEGKTTFPDDNVVSDTATSEVPWGAARFES